MSLWPASASWPVLAVEATFKLDKSILGGTVVRIGSTVYDGSVRGRLERLKEALMAASRSTSSAVRRFDQWTWTRS